mgnify:CR=1 FL=1
MHYGATMIVAQHLLHTVKVGDIGFNKFSVIGNEFPPPGNQIVRDDDTPPGFEQSQRNVTADVAGPTGDQHAIIPHFRIFRISAPLDTQPANHIAWYVVTSRIT